MFIGRSFLPSPGWFSATRDYSSQGTDIVMESIALKSDLRRNSRTNTLSALPPPLNRP